ncbi:MAG: exopolyphosphatase [bacterium]|nr:exopolyphosphatase [bacterium]
MYRSVTRADLDGIVCTVLLKQIFEIHSVFFTEAFPLQNGQVEIFSNDIITNLPYHQNCWMWFDHHASNEPNFEYRGSWKVAPSAARVVFDYFQDPRFQRFQDMVLQTDRIDSAYLTSDEIANPSGYFLIELTIHPKNPEDEPYWLKLIQWLSESASAEYVLNQSEGKMRAENVLRELEEYKTLLSIHSKLDQNIVITDFRTIQKLPTENRFLVYGLYPTAEISVKLANVQTKQGEMVKISLGRSIVNRSSNTNLGLILAEFGGGGHSAAGSVHVKPQDADMVLQSILEKLSTS